MWTTVAFQERRAAISLEELKAVPDQMHFVSGDDIRIGKWNRIIGLMCLGYAPQDAYVISPSLRAFTRVYIAPMIYHESSYLAGYLNMWDDRSRNPIPLETGESLNAFYEKSGDDPTTDDMIAVWLADAPITPVFGDIRTINASCTGTYPQLVWTSDQLTYTPDLPRGRYAIVGCRAYMTDGGGLVRFVFPEESQRPATIALSENEFMSVDRAFRMGYLGIWGTFDINNPPSVEILPIRDTTDCYMRIDIMKV